MMNPNLFDALEICLQALDQGADLESCLVRFPELAADLRPILTAAVQARSVSAAPVPVDVVQRGRARVLQAAAEMREQKKVVPALPFWRRKGFFGARFARLAVSSAAMIVFLLSGGTGLVNASSSALPGDHLYPVKRSWEGVRLMFVFDKQAKDTLEQEFDHKRVQEIEELYSEKRIAQVNFQGVVQEQKTGAWVIDGLNIAISNETLISTDILPGSMVTVVGETDDGQIKAMRITLLATPGVTPNPTSTSTSTATSTATRTSEPRDTETPTSGSEGIGGDNQQGNDETTPTLEPTQNSGDSSWENATSTPRPGGDGGGDSGGGEGSGSTPNPASTAGHHGGGGEQHGTHTPEPTDGSHENGGTPHPSETEGG